MSKKVTNLFLVAIFTFLMVGFGAGLGKVMHTQVISTDEKPRISELYKFEIVEQESEVIHVKPGGTKELKVILKNTGKAQWDLAENSENRFVLGTYLPRERESAFYSAGLDKWKNSSQIYIEDENGKTVIAPDETTTFKFEIKAPAAAGFYRENFAPVVTGIKGLNNAILTFDIVVDGDFAKNYDYEIVEKTEKESLPLNGTAEISMKLKNTGSVPWYGDGPFPIKLAATDTQTAELFSPEGGMIGALEVLPGETANFTFKILSPVAAGTYEMRLQLAAENLFVFESSPLIWNINVAAKRVALTFDDGYGDINGFLDVLKEQDVKATFFMLGCVAQNRPEEMKRIVEEGHLLASHSYNHPDFRTLGADTIRWQLNTTRDIMKEITGLDVYPYFRYPYGARNASTDAVLAQDGWKYFHWTNGTGDWKFHENSAAGRQHIYHYATSNPPDQAIVLMHVISRSTLAVLPNIIEWYRNHGYSFVTVDEL